VSKERVVWLAAAMLALMGACMVPPTVTPAYCGDGVVDEIAGEECDDGQVNSESCDGDCTAPLCGDYYLNPAAGEECDDGNVMSGDGCSATCLRERCVDGMQEPGCDAPLCGDGNLDPDEQCDTGGESPACDSDCTLAECGDGTVNAAAGEECDDDNLNDGDDCLTSCKLASCDDGIQNRNEENVDCGGPCEECWDRDGSQLATGRDHTCALTRAGAVRCWGKSDHGQLGYGNRDAIGDDEMAANAGDVDVGGEVDELWAGAKHTCALLKTGAVRCWGRGAYGQLGYGRTNDIGDDDGETPAGAGDVDVGGHVVQLTLGEDHTCALLDTGAVRCWGAGWYGQLGHGSTSNIGDALDESPATAGDVDVGGHVTQIAAGVYHTCALLDTGTVRCWGKNDYGQLGYGNPNNIGDELDETPGTAGDVNVGGVVVELAAGGYHTCALLDTGAVRCWGRNDHGQLGRGHEAEIWIPPGEILDPDVDVDVGGVVERLTAGGHHTCALLDTGAARCWGLNDEYQLGYGHNEDVGDESGETPAAAGDVNMGGWVVQLAAGRRHTCARLVTGDVRCWGTGMDGQLGHGTPDARHIGIPASAGDVPFQ
jgi:cysteine-rich repeat protein